MDENTLISLIKSGLPIGSSTVSAIVGALITTIFLRRDTSVTEFEKVKAGKFEEVIDTLLRDGKLSYMEFYKCKNFLKIAKIADTCVKTTNDYEISNKNQQYNFDWFIRFFEYASNISNEDMQRLWGAVLAGEVNAPGKISFALLHALSMMRDTHANIFGQVSRFVLLDKKDLQPHLLLFVATNRDVYAQRGITPSALKQLERLGLIECDFKSEYIFLGKKVFRTGNKVITVYGDPDNEKKIKAGNVKFTDDGQTLYSIIGEDFRAYRSEILDFIISRFIRRKCTVDINGRWV